MFSSNIEATLGRASYEVHIVDDLSGLEAALTPDVDAVILDLHAGLETTDVVGLCTPLGVPVLAFGRHTEPALLRAAREAGCAQVVPRSTFVEEMAALVKGLKD